MTPGQAALVALAGAYLDAGLDDRVTTLELHKLAYFMQLAGEKLRLRFEAHVYGPYADALRNVLGIVEGHYISGLADDASKPMARVELLAGALEEAHAFLAGRQETKEHMQRVLQLIDGFEDAYGLELMATTHWVMAKDWRAVDDAGVAAELVREWSPRKAAAMKPAHVEAAWGRLRSSPWALAAGGAGVAADV